MSALVHKNFKCERACTSERTGDWGRQLWACAPGTALQDGTRLCHQDDFQGYVHQGRPETLVQHGEATSKLQRGHPLPFLSIYMEVQHAFD
eukprot:scaffold216285_cov16-Tisochrysis_lutea.AAC.1